MWFHSLLASLKSGRSRGLRAQPHPARRRTRLVLEHLEDRALPSSYTANTAADLISDINAANAAGGSNTITLTAASSAPYVLTVVNNTTTGYGATGLPVIAANDNLSILGSGDTIERSTATGTPDFRLLRVASGGSLTLENLKLQGGMIEDSAPYHLGLTLPPGAADGGAIYNQGTLVLNGVIVQGNAAGAPQGSLDLSSTAAFGGGIYSVRGSVTLEGGTIVQNNEAIGTNTIVKLDPGGAAYGGGVYASGGTLTVTNATLDNNTATAGYGVSSSASAAADGGGLYAFGATIAITNATVDGNIATSTMGRFNSYGGGLYLVFWYASTVTNCKVQGNSAYEGGGLYVINEAGGTLTADLTNCTVQGNSAYEGGGLYIASSNAPVTLQGDTIESNSVTYGWGGGLYIAAYGVGDDVVTLQGDTIESNSANSPAPGNSGWGGGIYIASEATVYLDRFTVANTINNTDSTGLNGSTANIDGTYILL